MAGLTSNLEPTVIAAEQRAREFLAQKQWRQARDELKKLTKIDRPRFLPLLIKANIGLSREMMAKGQVADAQQVLSYLAGMATTEQLRAAELEFTSQGEVGDLAKLASELANSSSALPESERLRLADKLVLTFQTPGESGPAEAGVIAELKAVQDGLLATTLQQWDRLPEMLRPIPHRSVFAHWSAFIRGVAAFHTGGSEKALRFLSNLPAGTIPAKASQSFLLWLQPSLTVKNGTSIPELALEGACRLLGQPGAGQLLLRADGHWKKGHHARSYRFLRDALPAFPGQNLGWLGSLTEFYFNAIHTLPESDQEDYAQDFEDFVLGQAKNGIEEMLAYRMFAIGEGDRTDWEGFLRIRERLYGANPPLASLVYGHLGRGFAALESDPWNSGPGKPVDGPAAVFCLKKAIALDPTNLDAHLILARLYTALQEVRNRNRLLDEMVLRFPEDKRVLVLAAAGCIDRGAYVKGLEYLVRARLLDQLDPEVPNLIVLARHRLAEQQFRQQRLEKARESLALAEPFLTDKPEDFQRSRWTARVQQGLMEQTWGDRAAGKKLLEEARAASPFPAAFLLFAHLACLAQKADERTEPFWQQLTEAVRREPRVGQLLVLLRIIGHWQKSANSDTFAAVERLLRKQVQAAARGHFTRDEARQLIELKGDVAGWWHDLSVLVKKVLAEDPSDPLFRFYRLLSNQELSVPSDSLRKQLEDIRQEAARRGDTATVQRAQRAMIRLDQPPPAPLPPFDEPYVDDEGDWDESEPLPELEEIVRMAPPALARQLSAIVDMLARLPDAELEQARRTRPRDVPAEVFDAVMETARRQRRQSRPKPRYRKSPQSTPAADPDEDDPNQPTLF